MSLSIRERARLEAIEARLVDAMIGSDQDRLAALEQNMAAIAQELIDLSARLQKIESRSKPGPKPKAQ